jgi:hypothetical protein
MRQKQGMTVTNVQTPCFFEENKIKQNEATVEFPSNSKIYIICVRDGKAFDC